MPLVTGNDDVDPLRCDRPIKHQVVFSVGALNNHLRGVDHELSARCSRYLVQPPHPCVGVVGDPAVVPNQCPPDVAEHMVAGYEVNALLGARLGRRFQDLDRRRELALYGRDGGPLRRVPVRFSAYRVNQHVDITEDRDR